MQEGGKNLFGKRFFPPSCTTPYLQKPSIKGEMIGWRYRVAVEFYL